MIYFFIPILSLSLSYIRLVSKKTDKQFITLIVGLNHSEIQLENVA